jgi:hypothetical protein
MASWIADWCASTYNQYATVPRLPVGINGRSGSDFFASLLAFFDTCADGIKTCTAIAHGCSSFTRRTRRYRKKRQKFRLTAVSETLPGPPFSETSVPPKKTHMSVNHRHLPATFYGRAYVVHMSIQMQARWTHINRAGILFDEIFDKSRGDHTPGSPFQLGRVRSIVYWYERLLHNEREGHLR